MTDAHAIDFSEACKRLREAGSEVRLSGGLGSSTKPPQIEAAVSGKDFTYVAEIVGREVCEDNVRFWIEQNIKHSATKTTRPYWLKRPE